MKKVFFENLDGLRFVAFFAIFLRHGFFTDNEQVASSVLYQAIEFLTKPSGLGVPFFFCLSGFLITYLLLVEKENYGKIHIGKFYTRRILRIWPLYYAVVLFGFFAFPWLRSFFFDAGYEESATLWKYLVFWSNFDQLENGLPYGAGLGVTWSLSVEEQFYLAWPLILFVVPGRFYSYLSLGLFILSQILLQVYHFDYSHTLGSMTDLSLGAFLAVSWHEKRIWIQKLSKMSKNAIRILYAMGFAILYSVTAFDVGNRIFITLFMVFVIFEQCFCEHSVFHMSRLKKISFLGTMTYGFYLLHTICNFAANNIVESIGPFHSNAYLSDLFLRPVISFTLTLTLGYLSYHYYEKPFLTLKKRFSLIKTSRPSGN